MARKDTTIARNTNFTSSRREWILGQPFEGLKAVGITMDVSGWNDPSASLTTGLADADTGAPSANDFIINILYK